MLIILINLTLQKKIEMVAYFHVSNAFRMLNVLITTLHLTCRGEPPDPKHDPRIYRILN